MLAADSTLTASHRRSAPPPLTELGPELQRLTIAQRILTVALPFGCVALYFFAASRGWWPLAVLAVMYESFVTYGSTSHDLVHRSLGLPRRVNDGFLVVIELLAFRGGHAYRLSHLHHHARYPGIDDVEGGASRMALWRTLLEGPMFQAKLWWWALRQPGAPRAWILAEGLLAAAMFAGSLALWPLTPVFAVYAVLMVMGSWVIPLVTSYVPHTPDGEGTLFQTRRFRGRVLACLAMQHLYHLEHHLYPSVPHHHWPELARRLDGYLDEARVPIRRLWF